MTLFPFKKYRSYRNLVNKHLKIIEKDAKDAKDAKYAKIEGKLTTYFLRHPWLIKAKFLELLISLMGDEIDHQSVATTEGYLKSFVSDALGKANELVVA